MSERQYIETLFLFHLNKIIIYFSVHFISCCCNKLYISFLNSIVYTRCPISWDLNQMNSINRQNIHEEISGTGIMSLADGKDV